MKLKPTAVPMFDRRPMWISQSRYHGDRFPRTLEEAFGPHTTPLSVERRQALRLRFVLALALAVLAAVAAL